MFKDKETSNHYNPVIVVSNRIQVQRNIIQESYLDEYNFDAF